MKNLRQHFNLQDDDHGDFSIEVDPREADWPTIGLLRELGFNRISIGVQDLDPDVQRAINRMQTLEQTRTIIEAARTLQYRSLNIDLIYGLPLQTPARFAKTVEAIIDLQPDRLSLFNYAHLPERFAPQRRINASDLPAPAEKLAMLEQSIHLLTDAGYRYIGMDHFALPDDELAMAQEDGSLQRNFQGYTTHGHCDLVGLGMSAISQIGDLYCQNHSDIAEYQHQLDRSARHRRLRCNQDDLIRRDVIRALICDFELSFARIEHDHAIEFRHYFAEPRPMLEQMAADGLIEISESHLIVQPAGRLLVRSICMLFDHYLPEHGNGASRASSNGSDHRPIFRPATLAPIGHSVRTELTLRAINRFPGSPLCPNRSRSVRSGKLIAGLQPFRALPALSLNMQDMDALDDIVKRGRPLKGETLFRRAIPSVRSSPCVPVRFEHSA